MQTDLFAPPLVPGLTLVPDLIDPGEEQALIALIDGAGLAPFRFQGWSARRLTASFGPGHDFATGRAVLAPPIPDALYPVRARMAAIAGLAADDLVQALLIRYDPGAAIGWHRDRPHFATITGLSLGAPATLRLRRRRPGGGFDRAAVPLDPRGAYVLDGEARRDWEHSILPQTGVRHSVTLRSLSVTGKRAFA